MYIALLTCFKTRNKDEALFSKLNRLCIGQILKNLKEISQTFFKKIIRSKSKLYIGWLGI